MSQPQLDPNRGALVHPITKKPLVRPVQLEGFAALKAFMAEVLVNMIFAATTTALKLMGSGSRYIIITSSNTYPTVEASAGDIVRLDSKLIVTEPGGAADKGIFAIFNNGGASPGGTIAAYDVGGAVYLPMFIISTDFTLNASTFIGLNTPFINLNASSAIQWGIPKVNPGGGAGATLNTIGGSGPGTALQEAWMPIKDSAGNIRWFPIWK